jgi:hypothetical protein
MDTTIRDCPGCGELLLGDATSCPQCGMKVAPTASVTTEVFDDVISVSGNENVCQKCGEEMLPGVVRCRYCGWYSDADLQRSADTRRLNQMYGSPVQQRPPATSFGSGEDDFELADDVIPVDEEVSEDYDIAPPEPTTASAATPITERPAETAPGPQATASTGTAPAGSAEASAAPPASSPANDIDHSIATGGDVLLQTALDEAREASSRRVERKKKRAQVAPAGHIFSFCGNGHRVVVSEKFRGRLGRCPSCKEPFYVPSKPFLPDGEQSESTEQASPNPAASKYPLWIQDVRLHRVNPTKLKLKADSLLNEYDTLDIGINAEHMLLATVFVGGGAFGRMQEPKKKAAVREAIQEHLATDKPLSEMPVPKKKELASPQLAVLKLVQPSMPGEESLFHDIPVFGVGRIAIRVPAADDGAERGYVSMTLSQFRKFVEALTKFYNIENFGAAAGVPLQDQTEELTCHYSDNKLAAVTSHLEFYKADPEYVVELIGRKCVGCGLVVSEDSRKKEKLGGASGSSIAKTPCPKCKHKFGDQSLFGLKLKTPAPVTEGT